MKSEKSSKSFPLGGMALARMDPQPLWSIFADMSQVPRRSKQEEAIRRHFRETIAAKGFEVREDKTGNLIVDVPATPGREGAEPLVLQAHMDMVCVKRKGSAHDFEKDPIKLIAAEDADGEPIVRADNTTLGADNGIGVAAALAAAYDDNTPHGPLEILITVNEEAGMTGAKGVEPDSLKGRRLLNLDSEEEGTFCVGCAGAEVGSLDWEFPLEEIGQDAEVIKVSVGGLRGGHSGMEIHKGRGNAVKILADFLEEASVAGLRLAWAEAGVAVNAIPDRAKFVVAAPRGTLAELEREAIEANKRLKETLGANDPDAFIAVGPGEAPDTGATSPEDFHRLLETIHAIPAGPLAMRSEELQLVETSTNPAMILSEIADNGKLAVELRAGTRSLRKDMLSKARVDMDQLADHSGSKFRGTTSYPPWEPMDGSPLLAACAKVYSEYVGQEPKVETIHAGLECGLLAEKFPGMEMVSMGPRIEDAHTPDERVYVKSVERFWAYFTRLLDDLSRPAE